MSGKAVIESIAQHAARLIADNGRLRGEIDRLTASRDKLRDENRRLAVQLSEVERRLAVKELAAGFAGEGSELDRRGIKSARARVSRLMREVDRCIVLLNKE